MQQSQAVEVKGSLPRGRKQQADRTEEEVGDKALTPLFPPPDVPGAAEGRRAGVPDARPQPRPAAPGTQLDGTGWSDCRVCPLALRGMWCQEAANVAKNRGHRGWVPPV